MAPFVSEVTRTVSQSVSQSHIMNHEESVSQFPSCLCLLNGDHYSIRVVGGGGGGGVKPAPYRSHCSLGSYCN